MAFEPRATSFSMANAQILAQASAVPYDTPERCAKWASVGSFTGAFDFFDKEILKGSVEEIDDHSMHKHYLVRLKTSLPV
jgi:hypothetical protein